MKCKFCDEPKGSYCDDVCDFHLRESQKFLLATMTADYCIKQSGMEYISGTDRLMFSCKICRIYELSCHIIVSNEGLFEVASKGMSVRDIEKAGWRKINNKWHCSDCLKII